MNYQKLKIQKIYEIPDSEGNVNRYLSLKKCPRFDFYDKEVQDLYIYSARRMSDLEYDCKDYILLGEPEQKSANKQALVSLRDNGDLFHKNIPLETDYILQLGHILFYMHRNSIRTIAFGTIDSTEAQKIPSTRPLRIINWELKKFIHFTYDCSIIIFKNMLMVFGQENFQIFNLNADLKETFNQPYSTKRFAPSFEKQVYSSEESQNVICVSFAGKVFCFDENGTQVS